MTDEHLSDPLRRLAVRPDTPRPLSSDAQARIEARLDAAFLDAADHVEFDVIENFDDPLDHNMVEDLDGERVTPTVGAVGHSSPRRRWAVPAAAAAAVIVLVLGLAVIRTDDASPSVADVPGLAPSQFPADLLQPDTRWELRTDPVESDAGAAAASVTIRMQDDTAAQARLSTADLPPRQFLGEIRFDLTPTGNVLVPLLLLEPTERWLDCAATIDLNGSGTATCDDETIEYTATAGTNETVDTPLGPYDARPIDVDWFVKRADETSPDVGTRVWISPTVGPVRIEIDRGGSTQTFTLSAFDGPDPSTNTTIPGD